MKTTTDDSFLLNVEQYETLLQETKQTQLLKKNNNQSLSTKQYRRLKRYGIYILSIFNIIMFHLKPTPLLNKIRYKH